VDFVAIDVETANENLASICQVGIASFRDGTLVDSWKSFVNPEDDFSPINIYIDGITPSHVKDSPNWEQVVGAVSDRIRGQIVVSHTAFDRIAVTRACERYDVGLLACTWLDSARVVRRTWQKFAISGYGLSSVAQHFGIQYEAHDALEDARCAGLILLRAITETGLTPEQWLIRSTQPIDMDHNGNQSHHRDGSPDGELSGEVLVFTGALSLSRHDAADIAASLGCQVDDRVTKHTTILVVGDQDLQRLHGKEKSSKHLKAEKLVQNGQAIRILGESDFMRLVSQSPVLAHAN
jgi:DNA polymerase-3 subunit epsilon